MPRARSALDEPRPNRVPPERLRCPATGPAAHHASPLQSREPHHRPHQPSRSIGARRVPQALLDRRPGRRRPARPIAQLAASRG